MRTDPTGARGDATGPAEQLAPGAGPEPVTPRTSATVGMTSWPSWEAWTGSAALTSVTALPLRQSGGQVRAGHAFWV